MAEITGLLVKVRGDGRATSAALKGFSGGEVERILTVPATAAGPGIAASEPSSWLRISAGGGANPWDQAHAILSGGPGFAAAAGEVEAVEPDLQQQWPYSRDSQEDASAKDEKEFCAFDAQNTKGGRAAGPGLAWNFADNFSGLSKARAAVADKAKTIKIAHLDTGYDPTHITKPVNLLTEEQRNFIDKDFPNDASDRSPKEESFFRNRGHGTGTLSLLAGNKLDGQSPGWPGFVDAVGGAAGASIIPIRIADWVVRLKTSTMVQGFEHARLSGADVLSMSMGGLSSRALVDAINLAYEAGVVMVTAGGNNFASTPMPRSIVFPARYRRVLAACGVMADGHAYAGLNFGTMQGNFGPSSKMKTAIGAYTPNVPWAQIDCGKVVDMDGAGTSAATPQVAAAAALWLAQHAADVANYSKPWMRVEAVRRALFDTAATSTPKMTPAETFEKIGRGVLRADKALEQKPVPEAQLEMTPPAEASWSWLNLIFGGGVSLTENFTKQQREMFGLELTQMAHLVAAIDEAIEDPDMPPAEIPASQRVRYLELALNAGNPSKPLRRALEGILQRRSVAMAATDMAAPRAPIRRRPAYPPPPKRRLRTYALDPSLGKSLEFMALNETVLTVPWDDVLPWEKPNPAKELKPGPVGEYLEVVDVDPASNRIYEPVDLNNRALLAQDGWPPSEGNPQFHQQMVYAVGMTTIGYFERALGRRALWAPRGGHDADPQYVQRLRIYPHAFRDSNAYYSPDKKALLFGYFPAKSKDSDSTAPGSMVFSCLSNDIVAHEMTHALLDGLYRRFEIASNPDVPAFHEAFADIVALFQHFTITELVRFEVARSRSDLSAASLLGGLAKQFGEGSSRSGPLRNYLDPAMQELKYTETMEPHTRGSILVYAVYEAFLKIVARKISDLIRIATGGTGVLPSGALHPDLVNRVTAEACEAASEVLHMCIRALDYCPSVDITFGEYLRAVITADRDVAPDDTGGRRVAFMESFRNRGILPRDVRTVSEETLAWSSLDLESAGIGPSGSDWGTWLFDVLENKEFQLEWDLESDRSESFQKGQKNRWKMWRALKKLFDKEPSFYAQFGLVPNLPRYDETGTPTPLEQGTSTFEVSAVRPARRLKPNGTFQTDLIAVINQRRPEPIDGVNMQNGWFWFRGGATLILDPRGKQVRYLIVKNMMSKLRLERQRNTASGVTGSPLRALYFADSTLHEPFALMHSELSERENG